MIRLPLPTFDVAEAVQVCASGITIAERAQALLDALPVIQYTETAYRELAPYGRLYEMQRSDQVTPDLDGALMSDAFPNLRISDRSYVVDLKRVTCAGASSSLRMMLEYIRVTNGNSLAPAVEEILGCDEQEQVSGVSTVSVDSDPTLPQALKVALELMQKNIEEPLSLDDLAACGGISKRQLERRFFHFVGAAPARYYLELRLTRARQLVLQTNRSITDIAMATGFVSMPHFHRRFRDFFDAAPGSYRATYEVQK
ncbi:transcriptional regulator GlxA family with amidase domain [Pseudomonas sp. PvP001]